MRGEKGPPGDISAALHNVEEAAPKLVAAELKNLQITESVLRDIKYEHLSELIHEGLKCLQITELRGEPGRDGRDGGVGATGARGERGQNAVAPTKEIIESLIVFALQENQLLDESRNAGPLLKDAIQVELERLAVQEK
jgi:hypothetical protein